LNLKDGKYATAYLKIPAAEIYNTQQAF